MILNNITLPSSVDSFLLQGQELYIKRDDQISSHFSGNKFRKLYYYYMLEPFPYTKIISYGGKQSNAMLSIAALAKMKKIPFIYYMKKSHDSHRMDEGNFTQAISLGMNPQYIDVASDEALRDILITQKDDTTLFIPQGGASKEARIGIEYLAEEIVNWKESQNINNLIVLTPSGTGTTAFFLHQCLKDKNIEVLTTAVVGTRDYLEEQMLRLNEGVSLPQIISSSQKYPFAKPKIKLYDIYQEVLNQGIELDLIYAPVLLDAMLHNANVFENKIILYLHSGGVSGNQSQVKRYEKILRGNDSIAP